MKMKKMHILACVGLVLTSCSKKSSEVFNQTISGSAAYVNLSDVRQKIDGIGGSTAWSGQLSENEANALFSNGNDQQIGLSILRVRIDPANSWTDEKINAQKAKARGATILATPWTPPASMKSNNNLVGGTLNTSQYQNYANYLKDFCSNLGNVDVISIQNEPNISVDYESCTWNATQLLNFVNNNAASIGKPIMIPEAYNFDFSLSDPTLNDATAVSKISYIGGHIYGPSPTKYDLAINKGKKVWMTEHYQNYTDINTCLNVAKEIHDCMTVANYNAYIWWTLKIWDCTLITDGVLNKKAYTIGQFSKFVRPGYNRVDATNNPSANVYVSAYKGNNKTVIVAVNTGTTAVNQPFIVQNGTVSSLLPYRTSSAENMLQLNAISLSNGTFTAALPAQSVTTFVQN